MAAGARGGGARGGTGRRKRPRDGGGEGRREGGRSRDGRGTKRGMARAEWGTTEATKTTSAVASGRRRTTEDLSVSTQDNITGGKYHIGGRGTEERKYKIAK